MTMGYDTMDHADWVQDNLNAIRRRKPSPRDAKAAAAGRGWYGAPEALNDFHRRAFTILGVVGGGFTTRRLNGIRWNGAPSPFA